MNFGHGLKFGSHTGGGLSALSGIRKVEGKVVSSDPKLASDRPVADMRVVQFNGVDQHGTLQPNIDDIGDVTVTVVAEFTKIDNGTRYLFGLGAVNFRVGVTAGNNYLYIGSTTINTVSLPVGEVFTLSVVFVGGNAVEAILNGASVWTGSIAVVYNNQDWYIACKAGGVSNFWSGSIAHLEITGDTNVTYSFQETSGSTVFDRSGGGNHATLINNPTRAIDNSAELADYDVVNTIGYSKAVQGDGATGRINTGITADTVTSMKARFVVPPINSAIFGCNGGGAGADSRLFAFVGGDGVDILCYIGSGSNNLRISGVSVGDECTLELMSNGDVFFDDVLQGNTGGTTAGVSATATAGFFSRQGDLQSSPSEAILLQAWVNGNEIDIHDTNLHVGTINELVVPPSSNNDGLDALGNPLDVKGSAYPALPVPVGSKGLGFTPSQYADSGIIPQSSGYLETVFRVESGDTPSNLGILMGSQQSPEQGSNKRCFLGLNGNRQICGGIGNISYNVIFGGESIDSDWHTGRIEWDGVTVILSLDGTPVYTGTQVSVPTNDNTIFITAHNREGISQPIAAEIAHASINGVSIPFNNNSPYDVRDGNVVNFISNPTVVDQDVYHAELEDGFYKAVHISFGGIRGGANLQTFTSIKFKFIVGDGFNRFFFGTRSFTDPQRNIGGYITTTSRVSFQFGAESYLSPFSITFNTGDEREIEMRSNGELLIDGVLVHTFSGTLNNVDDTEILLAGTNNNGTLSSTSHNHIILQAWVNGNEIDIHDTNLHVGTIETHRLVGYSELTNPPIDGHNDGSYLISTEITESGDQPPAWNGLLPREYAFGDAFSDLFRGRRIGDHKENRLLHSHDFNGSSWTTSGGNIDIVDNGEWWEFTRTDNNQWASIVQNGILEAGETYVAVVTMKGSNNLKINTDDGGSSHTGLLVLEGEDNISMINQSGNSHTSMVVIDTSIPITAAVEITCSGTMTNNARFRFYVDTLNDNIGSKCEVKDLQLYKGTLNNVAPDYVETTSEAIVVDGRTGYDRLLGLTEAPTTKEQRLISKYLK